MFKKIATKTAEDLLEADLTDDERKIIYLSEELQMIISEIGAHMTHLTFSQIKVTRGRLSREGWVRKTGNVWRFKEAHVAKYNRCFSEGADRQVLAEKYGVAIEYVETLYKRYIFEIENPLTFKSKNFDPADLMPRYDTPSSAIEGMYYDGPIQGHPQDQAHRLTELC